MTHRIAVMAGDGVGPELIEEALRVLETVARLHSIDYETDVFPHSADHYRETGVLFDEAAYERLRVCDSLLFGAAGDPGLPIGTMERALILDLARNLGLDVGLREVFLHTPDLSPVSGMKRGDVDLVIVRNSSEGEVAIPGGSLQPGTPYEATASIVMHTRFGVDRALSHAFRLAEGRRGKLRVVCQANGLTAHRIWAESLERMAGDWPGVEAELLYPDHAASLFITDPASYDVIATTTMLGGIYSDLGAALIGGIGLIGSARINPDSGMGMFEPAHGSAPKYAGLGRVCPLATFKALAMLLDHLGETAAAGQVNGAIDEALVSRRVPDVTTRSPLDTSQVTDVILELLEAGDRADAGDDSGLS